MNDVWIKTAQFLGALNGEDIKRDSYVRTPEFIEAEQMWKEKQAEWDTVLSALPGEQQSRLEEMKECLEGYASAMEKRAYIQGYADCVQVLYHMGILKEHPGLKVPDNL